MVVRASVANNSAVQWVAEGASDSHVNALLPNRPRQLDETLKREVSVWAGQERKFAQTC